MQYRTLWFALIALAAPSPLRSADEQVVEAVCAELRLDRALQGGNAQEWMRTAHLGLSFQGPQAVAGKIGLAPDGGLGGWSVAGWAGRVERLEIKRDGDRITGTVESHISSNLVGGGRHIFTVDARVEGKQIVGTFRARHGEAGAEGKLTGNVKPHAPKKLDPRDAWYVVALDRALPRGEVLRVYLHAEGGKVRHGFAFAPPFSRRPFELDVAALTIDGNVLEGELQLLRKISKTPDMPTLGRYRLKVELAGDRLKGGYTGSFGEGPVRGDAWGEAEPHGPAPDWTKQVKVWIKMEDGLFGGADWQNRAFFDFTLENGTAKGGKLFNNKGVYEARLTEAQFKSDGRKFGGTLRGTVESGAISRGDYTFELDGHMVGGVVCGRFTTRLGDRVKTGYFVGGVSPPNP